MKAAITLSMASAALAQVAAPAGAAALSIAGSSSSVAPSGFAQGYFNTVNTVLANSARPEGSIALPLLPGVNEILLPLGSAVLNAPAGLLKGYFNAVNGLLSAGAQGASSAAYGAASAAASIPSVPVAAGTASGAPVVFPIVIPDLTAPIGTLYNVLTGVNATKPLFVTVNVPAYDPVAFYNSWPAPLKAIWRGGDSLGRGIQTAFITLLKGMGGALASIVGSTGAASASVLDGAAAAARDISAGSVIGLQQALATLPQGSYVVPVTLTGAATVAAPVAAAAAPAAAAAAPVVAKRFVA